MKKVPILIVSYIAGSLLIASVIDFILHSDVLAGTFNMYWFALFGPIMALYNWALVEIYFGTSIVFLGMIGAYFEFERVYLLLIASMVWLLTGFIVIDTIMSI